MQPQGYRLVLLLGVAAIAGCRHDPQARQAVSGMVYFNSQPLDGCATATRPMSKT
jgi:hypothetical protein